MTELQAYLEDEDYENYTIKIHSIKSTSLSIGAKGISDMALSLETAGKEKRYLYIAENHLPFQQAYQKLLAQLQEVLYHFKLLNRNDSADGPVLNDDIMNGLLANIQRLLDNFDFGQIFEILAQLANYRTTEKQSAFFERLKILMDELNVDEIKILISSFLEENQGTAQ